MRDAADLKQCFCDQCGKAAQGDHMPGGWWGYPAGWLTQEIDDGIVVSTVLVCSRECAAAYAANGCRCH